MPLVRRRPANLTSSKMGLALFMHLIWGTEVSNYNITWTFRTSHDLHSIVVLKLCTRVEIRKRGWLYVGKHFFHSIKFLRLCYFIMCSRMYICFRHFHAWKISSALGSVIMVNSHSTSQALGLGQGIVPYARAFRQLHHPVTLPTPKKLGRTCRIPEIKHKLLILITQPKR